MLNSAKLSMCVGKLVPTQLGFFQKKSIQCFCTENGFLYLVLYNDHPQNQTRKWFWQSQSCLLCHFCITRGISHSHMVRDSHYHHGKVLNPIKKAIRGLAGLNYVPREMRLWKSESLKNNYHIVLFYEKNITKNALQ